MRGALILSSLALGLTACAPEGKDSAPSPLSGYELASAKSAQSELTIIDLTPKQLVQAVNEENVRLIDVRRDDEVAEGIIPGAEHIAMDEFDPSTVTAGDDRPIILYCRSGRRSRIVGEKLATHTGRPTVHLAGGLIAYKEAAFPVAKPR